MESIKNRLEKLEARLTPQKSTRGMSARSWEVFFHIHENARRELDGLEPLPDLPYTKEDYEDDLNTLETILPAYRAEPGWRAGEAKAFLDGWERDLRETQQKGSGMTELRDELKMKPGEGSVDYVERAEAVLERHREETGECLTLWGEMPGERPGEVLARFEVLREVDGIRAAEWDRRHGQPTDQQTRQKKEKDAPKDISSAAEDSSRRFRIKSQERDVERAVSEFEAAKKRLFRSDGSKVYGEEEHAERLGKLTDGLREKAEAVATEAQSDVEGYEREALALSYTDPASLVPASDRGRLETSRPFVKEDCETLDASSLTQRLEAVSAGSDKVAKVLHARYARTRLEALEAESSRLAGEGRPAGADKARENRALGEAVAKLEAALEDPQKVKRVQGLKEAAEESRGVALDARKKVSELDGNGAAARERQRAAIARDF